MWRRGNCRRGFGERFGRLDSKIKQARSNRHVLWIHAVSGGEVNVCTQLIRALEPRVPNLKVVVSTTTSTGMGELQRKLPSYIEKIYYPIDHKKCVHRALSLIHPEAVVLVEAEIWPNFIWRLRDKRVPQPPDEIRPDFGLNQNDGLGMNQAQCAVHAFLVVDGIINLFDVRRQFALQFAHAGRGCGGNNDFEVGHARFQRADELRANVHLATTHGVYPEDLAVTERLFDFGIEPAKAL